jgi:protein TonB
MRPAPEPAAPLRALRPSPPGRGARAVGRPGPEWIARPPTPRNRTLRVLAAGLVLSALGHAALALWLVQTPAPPPPDGPDVPASEVLLLSGAQFAALTAPRPEVPDILAPDLPPPPDGGGPPTRPQGLAPALPALRAVAIPAPVTERAPDVAALTTAPPDPQVVVLMPEMTAPQSSPTGVPVPRHAAHPVARVTPMPSGAPGRADPGPVAPEAPPAPPAPAAAAPGAAPKTAQKAEQKAAPKLAAKPAAQAGDGGAAETTRARTAGSAEARDGWLSAIRARVERRKAYPSAAGRAEGRVTLQLTVDRSGRLAAVGVARSSGNPTLDAAALRAVKSAGRFPKAPAAVTEAAVTFNLPLRFSAGS